MTQVMLDDALKSALRFSATQQLVFSDQRRMISPQRFHLGRPLLTLRQTIISNGKFTIHRDLNKIETEEQRKV